MKASKRLQPILRLASQQEKAKAKSLKVSQMQLQKYQQQLENLISYGTEYKHMLQRESQTCISTQRWQLMTAFLEKIADMITNQHRAISEAKQVIEVRRHDWLESNKRFKIFEKLVERYQQNEAKEISRQEQKTLDEIAQQILQRQQ